MHKKSAGALPLPKKYVGRGAMRQTLTMLQCHISTSDSAVTNQSKIVRLRGPISLQRAAGLIMRILQSKTISPNSKNQYL